ncbi:MAG: hypothetical protein Q8R37_01360 [Nanoarchaeota archaeon]|nr:hypothetical protein [Nanoarchaeota archaeon]
MITQIFLRELEMSLLRSYGFAVRNTAAVKTDTSVLGNVTAQDLFVKQFMAAFDEKRASLEREIVVGGNRDAAKLFDQVQRMVDAKVRVLLFHKQGKIDEKSFQSAIRELKTEVRSVFYNKVSLKDIGVHN